jgi:hypothetical protein
MTVQSVLTGLPYGGQTRNPFNYVKVEQIGRDIATNWLTAGEITQQLNLFDDESQDDYILSLDLATRMYIEDYLGMSIFPVTYRVWYGAESLTATPVSLDLPEVSQNFAANLPPLTVNSVGYYNSLFPPVFVPVNPTQYFYDNSGNKIIITSLPTDINTQMTAPIVVQYTTVANPLAQYPVIKQAGLLILTHLYNNRSDTTETKLKTIPYGAQTLLRPYKPLVM